VLAAPVGNTTESVLSLMHAQGCTKLSPVRAHACHRGPRQWRAARSRDPADGQARNVTHLQRSARAAW